MIKAVFDGLFIFIDPLQTITDKKAYRSVMALIMLVCFVTGHFVIDFGRQYISPVLNRWITQEEKVETD